MSGGITVTILTLGGLVMFGGEILRWLGEALYWEHLGHAAVRVGDWKLVRLTHKKPWELYNIKADRCELHNLAGANPKQVQELSALWETWALRAQVKPGPKIH